MNKDGRVQILHIKSLSLSDSGVYMCKIGERQTSARLEVDECKTTDIEVSIFVTFINLVPYS